MLDRVRLLDPLIQGAKSLQFTWLQKQYASQASRKVLLDNNPRKFFKSFIADIPPFDLDPKNILIFKPDDIGDAVYLLPAVKELRTHYKNARLFLLCQNKTRPLFEATGLFDEISSFDVKMHFLRFPKMNLPQALKFFPCTEFDLSIFARSYPSYFNYFKKIPSKRMYHPDEPRLRSCSKYKIPLNNWGKHRSHQVVQQLDLVFPLTEKKVAFEQIEFPKFSFSDEDKRAVFEKWGQPLPEAFLVIHPFILYETRSYPSSYWELIYQWLDEKYKEIPLVVIGGKADPRIVSSVPLIQLQGQLSLTQSMYLVSNARAFIGIPSGPAHIAGAMGIPTITFFSGHCSKNEWGPLGQSLVLEHKVECAPCYRRSCPINGLKCLTGLKPEDNFVAISDFLKRLGSPF